MTCNQCHNENTHQCRQCKDIQTIADHYGYEPQSDMLIEEMGELIQAIKKYKRKGYMRNSDTYRNLIEEIADVSLVIDQLIYLLQCESKVAEIKRYKVVRTKERMWGV